MKLATVLAAAVLVAAQALPAGADRVDPAFRLGESLIIAAPPPPGSNTTFELGTDERLAIVAADPLDLVLDSPDLVLAFDNAGSVRIAGWLESAQPVALPGGRLIAFDELVGLLFAGDRRIALDDLIERVDEARSSGESEQDTRSTEGHGDAIDAIGRAVLHADAREEPGFGAYSYLLFYRQAAAGVDFERRLAAVKAFAAEFGDLGDVRRFSPDPARIAVFYAPVAIKAADAESTGNTRADGIVDLLLNAYDIERARHWADGLGLSGAGPFVVTGFRPLGGGADPDNVIVQDLSNVDPRLVDLWLLEFRREAITGELWGGTSLRRIALELRTRLAALAETFALTREAVADIIKTPVQ